MTDFLDIKRKEISDRLRELKPLVDEYNRLQAADGALAGMDSDASAETVERGPGRLAVKSPGRPAGTRGPGRPRKTAATATTTTASETSGTGKRGRRKGSGTRARQALELVAQRPGITIPELAKAMKIKQNYLYRVIPTLQSEGKVAKRGRGWYAA